MIQALFILLSIVPQTPLISCPTGAHVLQVRPDLRACAKVINRRVVLHGPWQRLEQGRIKREGSYYNGRRSGTWIMWAEWPKHKMVVLHYKAGKLHGRRWENQGTIEVIAHYRNGQLHGRYHWSLQDADASRTVGGQYRNGKKHGKWIHRHGNRSKTCTWKDGRQLRCR